MGWVVRDESDRAYRVEGTLQLGRGHLATHDVHCSRRQALLTARHDALVIQAVRTAVFFFFSFCSYVHLGGRWG